MTPVVHEEDQMEMDSTEMLNIASRKQQLEYRKKLLLEMQEFLIKNNFKEGSFKPKEDQGLCELGQIERELHRLSERERELMNGECLQGRNSTQESSANVHKWCNGEPSSSTPVPEVKEVNDLSLSPAMVKCPTCQQHVITEVQRKVGNTSFLLCCFCTLLGCVGGCCLLPFFLNYFKDTSHLCPSCHTEIQIVPRI